jgi:hypothetical protein
MHAGGGLGGPLRSKALWIPLVSGADKIRQHATVMDRDVSSPTNVKADCLTIQLSHFGQNEKQKLVAINGHETKQPLESLDGLITGGKFGSLLLGVYDPSSSADF